MNVKSCCKVWKGAKNKPLGTCLLYLIEEG